MLKSRTKSVTKKSNKTFFYIGTKEAPSAFDVEQKEFRIYRKLCCLFAFLFFSLKH